MVWAAFRTSGKRYRARPPANCRAARAAWDVFAAEGPVEWLQLLDGHWGAKRPGNPLPEEIEAALILQKITSKR